MPILIRNATADELLTTSGSSGGTALVSRARVQLRSSPELVINVYRSRSVFSFQTMTYQVHVSSLRLTSNYNEKACNCESIATQRPPDIAPAVLAYYQHFLGFLGFFCSKRFFCTFWEVLSSNQACAHGATYNNTHFTCLYHTRSRLSLYSLNK